MEKLGFRKNKLFAQVVEIVRYQEGADPNVSESVVELYCLLA
jgi:hypothetical protein